MSEEKKMAEIIPLEELSFPSIAKIYDLAREIKKKTLSHPSSEVCINLLYYSKITRHYYKVTKPLSNFEVPNHIDLLTLRHNALNYLEKNGIIAGICPLMANVPEGSEMRLLSELTIANVDIAKLDWLLVRLHKIYKEKLRKKKELNSVPKNTTHLIKNPAKQFYIVVEAIASAREKDLSPNLISLHTEEGNLNSIPNEDIKTILQDLESKELIQIVWEDIPPSKSKKRNYFDELNNAIEYYNRFPIYFTIKIFADFEEWYAKYLKEKLTLRQQQAPVAKPSHKLIRKYKPTKQQDADHTKYAYLCHDHLYISGDTSKKEKNKVYVNDLLVEKMTDAPFLLLIELVVKLKKDKSGWVEIPKEGRPQKIHRLKEALKGRLNVNNFIENEASQYYKASQYRISTHPDFITYNKKKLSHHPSPAIKALAKKLPKR